MDGVMKTWIIQDIFISSQSSFLFEEFDFFFFFTVLWNIRQITVSGVLGEFASYADTNDACGQSPAIKLAHHQTITQSTISSIKRDWEWPQLKLLSGKPHLRQELWHRKFPNFLQSTSTLHLSFKLGQGQRMGSYTERPNNRIWSLYRQERCKISEAVC